MKNMVLAFGFLTVTLFVGAMISSIEIDSSKEQTLTENVRIAVYQTMSESEKNGYDNEKLVACFKRNLKELMQTEDAILVRILDADVHKGILAVEVKQVYRNWGKTKEIQTTEAVIRDC